MNTARHQRFCLKPVYAALLLAFAAQTVQANPLGYTVINGQASFNSSGNTLTVTNTPGAIIHWQDFSIQQNEITRFAQQGASSAVLNRVVGGNTSQILGALQSNGRVFLVNPNGIVFGAGSTVDVAGLVATSLNLSDADFLGGRHRFTSDPNAQTVSNAGNLTAQQGGEIWLIAPDIENAGIINAPNGEILLAAGSSVELVNSLDPNLRVSITAPAGDATNVGQLVAEAGRLGLFGTIVKNSGTVSASSAVTEGGKIYLRATDRIELADTSKVGADGTAGGEVTAIVSRDGAISGELVARGEISAQGDGTQGSGGFVETSAVKLDLNGVTVKSNGGEWLLDPYDFTIAASGGDITGSALATALGSSSVTIQTTLSNVFCTNVSCGSGNVSGNGDIFVNDAVTWNAATSLVLSAYRNIDINQSITSNHASGVLVLEYGQGALASGNTATYNVNVPINLQAGNNFNTKLGSDGSLLAYTVITSLGSAGDTSSITLQGIKNNLLGRYVLGSNIDASATATWNSDGNGDYYGFSRIGDGQTFNDFSRFTGIFDGLGHTISNLTIKVPTVASGNANDYVGLFGVNKGTIQNVGLVNAYVTGNSSVGAIVGVGGVNSGGLVSKSYATGTVVGVNNVGGLVGQLNGGTVSYSYATVDVTGNSSVGGLVGVVNASAGGAVSNSYALGSVTGLGGATAGGLVGALNSVGTITNSYAAGLITTSGIRGGLVGSGGGAVTNSYWDTQTTGVNSSAGGTGFTTAQMVNPANFTGWDFTNVWNIEAGTSYPYLRNPEQTPHPASLVLLGGIFWDGGGSDWLWINPLNWSADTLPGASSDVTINVQGVVTLSSGDWAINSLVCTADFAFTGGSLTIADSAEFTGGLDLSTGTALTAQGMLSLGAYTLAAGARIDITQSGAEILTIGGQPYTVINDLGAAGSITGLDLQGMNGNLTGHYAIGSNIDASATSGWNSGAGFLPVGFYDYPENNAFTGAFDGLGHTITGLYINRPSTSWVGLFGFVGNYYLTSPAVIRNVGMVNVNITGQYRVGGLAGQTYHNTLVSNAYTTGTVTGYQIVGGLVGFDNGINSLITGSHSTATVDGWQVVGGLVGYHGEGQIVISNSYATGNVSGTYDVGGLVGWEDDGFITDSYSTGNVTGWGDGGGGDTGNFGGFVGENQGNGTISNSYSTGAVTAGGSVSDVYGVGGFVGDNRGTISNSYSTGNVAAAGNSEGVGGFAGWNNNPIIDSYSTGNVTGYRWVGGLVGDGDPVDIVNSYYNIDAVLINGQHRVTPGALYNGQFQYWFDNGMSLDIANYNSTLPLNAGYYEIGLLQGMKDLLGFAGNPDYRFRLVADIDLTVLPGYYIPYFTAAEFDGNGHTIANLSIDLNSDGIGMFGYVGQATITNLGVVDVNIVGNSSVGGLIGAAANSIISKAYTTGSVTGNGPAIGGIVGSALQTSISDAYSTANVSGSEYVGGLVGYAYWTSPITNTYATGSVSGTANVGGLVGYIYNAGSISASYWNTETSGQAGCIGGVDLGSAGCTGLTTTEMKQQANFSGWGFAETWGIDEGASYPYLLANEQVPHPGGVSVVNDSISGSDSTSASDNLDFLDDMVNTMLIPGNGASGSSQSTIGGDEGKKKPPPVVLVDSEIALTDGNIHNLPVCR